jgi:hypothetical protein
MKQPQTNTIKTMLTISMGFLVVYLIGHWNWALIIALSIGIIGMFSDFLSAKVEWIWMKLTKILSLIVPNILLGAVFYVILFPIAILSRLFSKKDPLQLNKQKLSYYLSESKVFKKYDFTYPW